MSDDLNKSSNGDVEKSFTTSGITDLDSMVVPKHKNNDMAVVDRKTTTILDRYINFPAVFNFELVLQSSWAGMALIFQFGMINGGPVALVYGTIVAGIGNTFTAMSLAEMASTDPEVGAQYRWSAKYAPFAPRFWSLIQGWLTVSAWIFEVAAVQSVLSNLTTALIIFNNPDYVKQGWHSALLMWLYMILPLLPNIWFRKLLNVFETLSGFCCVVFFLINIIVLTVLNPRSSTSFVFTTFFHQAPGWTNPGIAWSLGYFASVSALVGMDGVLHMSDEVKDVKTRVPYSIVSTVISNVVLLFAFVICLLFTLGDLDLVLGDTTGSPIIQVYYQATKSKAWTNVLMTMLAMMMFFCLSNTLASVSRLTWAFARDRGLPFSDFFTVVHPTLKIPLNALLVISIICMLLSLINIGSAVAFNAIISLAALGIMFSYILPILFILIKRLNGSHIEFGPYKLGRWGIPINFMALVWVCFNVFWIPWPIVLPVTAETMNYAGPVFLAVVVMALADWFIGGHKRFEIPVPGSQREDVASSKSE